MSVALHGNLRDFGVGEVFQLIGHQRKTGVLEVVSDEARIRIAFDHGAVVRGEPSGSFEGAALADMLVRVGLLTRERRKELDEEAADGDAGEILNREIGEEAVERVVDLLTQETLFDLLRREKGSFHFTAGPVRHRRDPSRLLPAEQILMDGLRMVDEWRSLDAAATRDDTVFERAQEFSVFRAQSAGMPADGLAAAERLYLLIDGRVSARRVIDLSRMGTFEAAVWLSRLHESRIIRSRATVAPRRLVLDTDRRFDPWQLVAGAPFAVLALVVGLILARPAPGPAAADTPAETRLVVDPVDAATVAAATQRLSRELQVRRFSPDGVPSRLEPLGRVASPPTLLASKSASPYYFNRRGGSYVLLAPDSFVAGTHASPSDRQPRSGPSPGERTEPRRTGPRAEP